MINRRIKMKRELICILYVLVGVVAIISAALLFNKTFCFVQFTEYRYYGGDAYTGIQHAAKDVSDNVRALTDICSAGFGFIVLFIGLLSIIKGMAVLVNYATASSVCQSQYAATNDRVNQL